jgi:hypothetical protein
VTQSPDPRERARLVFERFARLDPEALTFVSLTATDDAEAKEREAQVVAAGRSSGRSELLADVEREARDRVLVTFNQSGYRPQPFGLNWGQTLGPASDRVAIAMAVRDAAAAAVLEDVLSPAVLDDLRESFETLLLADQPGRSNVLLGIADRPPWVLAVLFALVLAGTATAGIVALRGFGLEALAASLVAIAIFVAIIRANLRRR